MVSLQSLQIKGQTMNKSDYMIKFDTTTFSILLAYFIKNTVKSMTYKCVVIEWE